MNTDQTIWDFLMSKIGNAYGVAGLMGNLYVESHLQSVYLQSSYSRKLGLSSAEYTKAVDDGSYTNFVHDEAGYGLAQWTHWSRKEKLLDCAKNCGTSIGDLMMQLTYLWLELQKYPIALGTCKSAKSIREASDAIALRYEKPKDTSEKALQNRAEFGIKYYNTFAEKTPMKEVVLTANKVNIRAGNDKTYSRLGQEPKGAIFEWVATSENGWHAIVYKKQVAWVSGEFSKIQ